MRTTIYWTVLHIRQAAREMRFRVSCWWLGQQVDFLDWRLCLEGETWAEWYPVQS